MTTRTSYQRFLRASVCSFAIGFVAMRSLSAQTCFESPAATPVGGTPKAIHSADLNGDGHPDLIALLNTPQFSISLNTGTGAFQPPVVTTGLFGGMQGATSADLDGDGDIDLAISAGGLFIALNQGGGVFPGATQLLIAGGILGVTHGDVDGDGDADLVTTTNSRIDVYLNQGSATFPSAVAYPTGQSPASPQCVDLDGDGDLDIVVVDTSLNRISVLTNTGNGTFVPGVTHSVPLNPKEVVTLDFDLDGDVDLTVTSSLGFSVTVLANQGNGTFATQYQYSDGSILYVTRSGDLNADGLPDVLVPTRSTILDNLGNGTFAARPLPDGGSDAAIVDLDGDGDLDLVLSKANVERVVTLFNRGDGTFSAPLALELTSVAEPAAGASGLARFDFDADGDLDLAVGKFAPHAMLVYQNMGNGAYQELPSVPLVGKPFRVESADFDGDGDADLAAAIGVPPAVAIVLNQGQGSFSTSVAQVGSVSLYSPLECADFDGDGDVDVVTGATNGASFLRNQGSGTFAFPGSIATSANLRALESLDFDADGDMDLVGVHANPAQLVFYANQGTGTFASSGTVSLVANGTDVRAADLDADGDLDLAIATAGSILSVHWQTGPGVFGPPTHYALEFQPSVLSIADWDGDGDTDILAASEGGMVGLLDNQGSGVLTVGSNWVARTVCRFGLPMDFDGDLDLDFLYTNFSTGPVHVLRSCRSPLTAFCAGDGTSAACPCGNLGAAGHGCANSSSASGALLGGSGNAFLSSDSVVLSASGTPDGPGLFIQSDGPTLLPFGDGLLCAGSQIRRLAVVLAVGGVSTLPNSVVQDPLHVLGDVQVGGVVRHYQLYFRDANSSFCTPATFNTTNGVSLTWAP